MRCVIKILNEIEMLSSYFSSQRKSRRPPTFNPEDYVVFLRKILSSTNANGGLCTAVEKLYGKESQMSGEMRSKLSHSLSPSGGGGGGVGDNRTSATTKPSSDVSEILKRLRLDLFFSFARYLSLNLSPIVSCFPSHGYFLIFRCAIQLLQGVYERDVRWHRTLDGDVASHPNGPSRTER